MGDPEAESVIPRIQNDLVDLFLAVSSQQLEKEVILTDPRYTGTVMLVSKGYPDQYEKGKVITFKETIKDSILFHAGTKMDAASGNTFLGRRQAFDLGVFGAERRAVGRQHPGIVELNALCIADGQPGVSGYLYVFKNHIGNTTSGNPK